MTPRFAWIRVMAMAIALLLSMVFGQKAKTKHARSLERIHVDLHNASLEQNHDLDLATDDAADAAAQVLDRIVASVHGRLTEIFSKATTPECRAMIGEHYGYFINAIGREEPLPFSDFTLKRTCPEERLDINNLPEGMHIGHVQNRTYQPPRNETEYIDDPANLRLLYGVLTHDNPTATIRLVNVLYEEGHSFVIHVDGKDSAAETQQALVDFAATRDYVHVLSDDYRVHVNWGGFSMVNATLQILRYALALDDPSSTTPIDFHKFVHMASTSYPIASNERIRNTLASFPLDANLMHVIMKPTDPPPHAWHYFVECDDAVHRIYRLKPLTNVSGGIDLHTSSQWFIISREFALYLAEHKRGTFVDDYLEYIQHVVVADETFFGSVLRNTEFCTKHHNWNYLHLQFDRWESDLNAVERDPKKCIMPSPDHCGRSPTTMTMDYMDILELTGDLFARKFDDTKDSRIKDVLDMKRNGTKPSMEMPPRTEQDEDEPLGLDQNFAGHGVLIVAKDTANDKTPLCLGLGPAANQARLVPCFHDWVPDNLAEDWVMGAVIEQETAPNNRWEFSPCTTDGFLRRMPSGELQMIPGDYSATGPRCMLKQMDGLRAGRCMDGDFGKSQPGGRTHVFPCVQRWHQFFSVGNGTLAPSGSLFTTIPLHIVRTLVAKGSKEQEAHLCLGVVGRGDQNEGEWNDDKGKSSGENDELLAPLNTHNPDGSVAPLRNWKGKQLVTTKCSNTDAIIEWYYVPYILEDLEETASNETSTADERKEGSTEDSAAEEQVSDNSKDNSAAEL